MGSRRRTPSSREKPDQGGEEACGNQQRRKPAEQFARIALRVGGENFEIHHAEEKLPVEDSKLSLFHA
jgi:hypothetical protein